MKKALEYLLFSCLFCAATRAADTLQPVPDSVQIEKVPMVFATYISNKDQAHQCATLCESIRKYAGPLRDTPVWVYLPKFPGESLSDWEDSLARFMVRVKRIEIPTEAMEYDLGIKPFIAAKAESECRDIAEIIVFLDPNVIVIRPPADLFLPDGKIFGYRPVIHQNIGSIFSEKPDSFWSRIYFLTKTGGESVFPIETVADKKIVRPYFNSGLIAVRPERGVLKIWARTFAILYADPEIVSFCQDERYRVFLHQAALAAAVLKVVKPWEYQLLPDRYNYPLFFEKFFDSEISFESVETAVTLKCEIIRDHIKEEWWKDITGPADLIEWLKIRLR